LVDHFFQQFKGYSMPCDQKTEIDALEVDLPFTKGFVNGMCQTKRTVDRCCGGYDVCWCFATQA